MTTTPRAWVEGGVVSAVLLNAEVRDQFNSFFGAWTSWTPTWVAEGGAAPTPGNGTLAGRYSTSLHYSARHLRHRQRRRRQDPRLRPRRRVRRLGIDAAVRVRVRRHPLRVRPLRRSRLGGTLTVLVCSLKSEIPQSIPPGAYTVVRFPFGAAESYDEHGMHHVVQPDGARVSAWSRDDRAGLSRRDRRLEHAACHGPGGTRELHRGPFTIRTRSAGPVDRVRLDVHRGRSPHGRRSVLR